MRGINALTLLAMLLLIIVSGTVFFRHVEGASWLDSNFFTVVTLPAVGYGELVPATALGKIGTTLFILLGLGICAVTNQQFGAYAVRKREEHTEWLIARLGHGDKHHKSEDKPANHPERPDT
ncbi:MAG: ion channel [Pseudomonadota bacterium]|uniref:ion channel n=1 Tax=Roseovarius TaxID=74030 RepID=UPI0022A6BA74|nr:potassium channel family protein [Roseovarius sp. EGI FJ00037]MCZ0810954.1 potassium channel family protein [Roseovarius sp. EGI FJ00037]